jgi:hypothetical protein
MKKLVVALAALLASSAVHAQEARRPVGVGIAINPLEAASPTIEVYLPVALGPTLRVEPSIGIAAVDRPAGQRDRRDFTIGAGLFYVQRLAAPFDMYMGGRLKLNFAHVSDPSDSGTDVLIAGAVGGEDFLTPHFSIGAEAQVGFRVNSDVSGDDNTFFTTGLAFLRFYF